MNFTDLYQKIRALDETGLAPTPTDSNVEECGDMMPTMHQPKQADNVSMNVSMNGSGSGGIQDLLAILKHIDKLDAPKTHGDDDVIFGMPGDHAHDEPMMGAIIDDMEEEYANSAAGGSGPEYMGVDTMTATGDDLASKGVEKLKVNGGGNPMQEALVSKLAQMYNEIKNEVYNPNSASAEHARSLKAHHKKELEKAAATGDEKAKAALKRFNDRQEFLRQAYLDRMER